MKSDSAQLFTAQSILSGGIHRRAGRRSERRLSGSPDHRRWPGPTVDGGPGPGESSGLGLSLTSAGPRAGVSSSSPPAVRRGGSVYGRQPAPGRAPDSHAVTVPPVTHYSLGPSMTAWSRLGQAKQASWFLTNSEAVRHTSELSGVSRSHGDGAIRPGHGSPKSLRHVVSVWP
jgi:hypothetical protein